jgi:uncharacterized protein (DUF305 family)
VTVINPVDVENAIRACSDRIAKGVKVCDERYRAFLEADHAYDIAFAHAMLSHDGPAYSKKYAAELATKGERKARDVADAAYKYADRQAKALGDELRAWQSVNASMRAMYAVAGAGVGA